MFEHDYLFFRRFFRLVILISLLSGVACRSSHEDPSGADQVISVKGSDTVLPLTQKLVEEYMKVNPSASISIVGGGSGTGITSLLDGSTDLCMSSRDMKFSEKIRFAEKNIDIREVIVGYDVLSVIVHPSNPVSQLTREQLEGIFTGKITNWKDAGGENLPIVAYCRESSSGTYEFFKEVAMSRKNYSASVLNMPATGAIVQSVSQTRGAIGYIGLGYMSSNVKPLALSYDGGREYAMPSIRAVKEGTYPVSRPLFYFYHTIQHERVNPFIQFILSQEGQQFVSEIGYVPSS